MTRLLILFLYSAFSITLLSAQNKDQAVVSMVPQGNQPNSTAANDSEKFADQYIHDLYLKTYHGKSDTITDFDSLFYDKVENPYPYIYALWFNEAVLGPYGKKDNPHQIRLMDKIVAAPDAQGTVKAATYYQKGMHYLFCNDFATAGSIQQNVGNIKNWQFTGPFENISHSGFYKNFGPLEHADNKTEFTSSTNAKVKWFSPAYEVQDGWTPVSFHFNKETGVVYAQTFVNSAKAQEIYCNAGGSGALKIWINDALVFSDETERITEMDTYTVRTGLQKGTNRILVQLSFTDLPYPNFSIRLTDANFNAIPGLTGSNVYKPYVKATKVDATPVKHFAEEFFLARINSQPGNMINYLLLADVYLRNKKLNEAKELVESAIQRHPDHALLHMKLIDILVKEGNRSRMLEEIERLKQIEPQSLLCLEIDILTDIANQRLEDALQKINQRISTYGETFQTTMQTLDILFRQKKFNEFIALAEKTYQKYPDNPDMAKIMFSINKEVNHDIAGALGVYNKFVSHNYNYSVIKEYSKQLLAQGQLEKGISLMEKILDESPYDPYTSSEWSDYYFTAKQYDKAESYITRSLKLSPYDERFWTKQGDIKREQQKTGEAIDAYNRSLQYNPNQYDVINKLRLLKGKSESYKLVPAVDIDKVIRESGNAPGTSISDAGFDVLLNEKNVIIHPGGATEEYDTYIVKIINEKGINEFKESTINYGRFQTLLIEQAEVIKPSAVRIRGERNENEVVFTNLEAGDVVVFKYRVHNYITGRFTKEYWNKQYFTGNSFIARTRFNLLIPASQKINYTWNNSTTVKPVIKDVEDFKQYTWEMADQQPVKDEPFMPALVDVASVLHVSTIPKWQDIADWYGDMTHHAGEDGYELRSVLNTILPEPERGGLSQYAKAQKIYNYILSNIRYSSVSFRQSAYVPQRATITLATRLGDCKDLSNLFSSLCRIAGIDCRMVLVNTYDNGEKDILLPSLEFNHCIAKAVLDNKEYYIELTDRYLPFASLPNNLVNGAILEIPKKNEILPAELKFLYPQTKKKDIARTTITITPDGNDLVMNIATVKYGHLSSILRSDYSNLTQDKQSEMVEQSVASNYKNNIIMERVVFGNLDLLLDSAVMDYTYRIKDEISEIGSIKTFKITYPDVVALISRFSAASRHYPINYNAYEDTDIYNTKVLITVPEGKKIIEVPADENLTFRDMNYTLTYKLLSPSKLQIIRTFHSNRKQIPEKEYPGFKTFLEKIVKAELKMIAFQ